MTPCKLCLTQTNSVYNIQFRAVPICEDCGRAIFLQQAQWYAKQEVLVSNDERTMADFFSAIDGNTEVSTKLLNFMKRDGRHIDKPIAKIRKSDIIGYKGFGEKTWDEFIKLRSGFLKT